MTERWRLSAFGDEIAWLLQEQVEALVACSIPYLELRSTEGIGVVDLGPQQLAGTPDELEASDEEFSRRLLAQLIRRILTNGPPTRPIPSEREIDACGSS